MTQIKTITLILSFIIYCSVSLPANAHKEHGKERIKKAQEATSQGKFKWSTYVNSKYQFQICYPNFMIPQGEADNGDGQKFIAKDGGKLTVYGYYNVINDGDFLKTVKDSIQLTIGKNGHITYQTYHQSWVVISGINNKKDIFYYKFLSEKNDRILVLEFVYPHILATKYNEITKKLGSCFKDINRSSSSDNP